MFGATLSSHIVGYFIHEKGYTEQKIATIINAPEHTIEKILNIKSSLTTQQIDLLAKESNLPFIQFIFEAVPEKDLPDKLKIIKESYQSR